MSETMEIVKADELQKDLAPVLARAVALAIITPEDYAAAGDECKAVKGAIKRIDEYWDPMVKANLEATRRTNEAKRAMRDPFAAAEGQIKTKQLAWHQEQEKIRMDAQRKLQAEADARAAREREALLKKAANLKTPQKAEALREQAAAVQATVVTVASVAPVVKGQSIRKKWKARIVDDQAVPRQWLMVNEPALQAFAAATKGTCPTAGVEFYEESILASGSR